MEKAVTWDKRHPEKARARKHRWRINNRDRDIARKGAYRARNREKTLAARRASMKKFRENNPTKVLIDRSINNAKRRARLLGLTPPLSIEERALIIALYAEARALTELSGESYHVDHIKPLAKGGLHHPSNLQILRGIDNLKKGCK